MKHGLYIHIPVCAGKCAYCDFVSAPMDICARAQYIDALAKEVGQRCAGVEFDTVFIGGGNPGALEDGELEKLLSVLPKVSGEFTVEVNPESVTKRKVNVLTKHGVNRVSLGLQTHDDGILAAIGRRHNYAGFAKAVEILRREEITNLNADVMLGLPNQDLVSAGETVARLIDLGLPHISVYSLKVEDGTPLHKSGYAADTDLQADMYDAARERLGAAGLKRYEVSNFARAGYECRHNLKYWRCEPYIGCGLAAHSHTGNERTANTADLGKYLRGETQEQTEVLTDVQMRTEYIMLGLRLENGIKLDKDLLVQKKSQIDRLTQTNCIVISNGRLTVAPDKFYVANGIIADLI